MAALEEVWSKKPATAGRLRQRIEAVLAYSKVRGFRSGDNPAGRELLAVLPKAKQTTHHKGAAYSEVSAAIRTIKASDCFPLTQFALEFLILTAVRSGEVRMATWDEIDWDAKTWTIPASRMKARREHRVPLSDQAMKLLWRAWLMGGGIRCKAAVPLTQESNAGLFEPDGGARTERHRLRCSRVQELIQGLGRGKVRRTLGRL